MKKQKIYACGALVKTEMDKNKVTIELTIADSKHDQQSTVNKILADMLLNCYQNIQPETAMQILQMTSEQLLSVSTFDQFQLTRFDSE